MEKFSLINISQDFNLVFKEDDVIKFEMPSFCSGDYLAIVKKDKDFGLYIDKDCNYFEGCRDFILLRNGKEIFSPPILLEKQQ
jgi:hypothetical protein